MRTFFCGISSSYSFKLGRNEMKLKTIYDIRNCFKFYSKYMFIKLFLNLSKLLQIRNRIFFREKKVYGKVTLI